MMSKIPIDFKNVKEEDKNHELLRFGIIAELDAINLYEQLASMTDNPRLRKVFLDVAREEKEHVGEFQALLLETDAEQVEELEESKKEVEELTQ